MSMTPSACSQEQATITYVCGIDIGSQSCAGCVTRPDKSLVGKPLVFANRKEGWDVLLDKLNHLDALPQAILIGMEATARYSENLYHAACAARLSAVFVTSGTDASASRAARAASPRQIGSMR
jgi:transposase